MSTMSLHFSRPHQLRRKLYGANPGFSLLRFSENRVNFHSAKPVEESPRLTFTDALEASDHSAQKHKNDELEMDESYLYSLSMCGS